MSHFKQSERMQDVPLSKIREMADLSNKMQKEGKPVIHLEIGEPDFDTPEYIKDACKASLDAGQVHYSSIIGVEPLREAICEEYKKYGITYTPEEVLITHGVTHGLFLAMMSFLNPGDEILVPDPGYLCYYNDPMIVQATQVHYNLDPNNDYQVIPGSIDSLVTPRTKMILINSPSNPCGSVLDEASLKEIARVAIEHDLIVISDEVYAGIVYDDKEFLSIAALPGMKERTIVMNGFSKYYSMTGWRIGYILCEPELLDPMMRLSFYSISCPNMFVQYAAAGALTGDDTPCKEMVKEYNRRRDFLYEAINKIPGLHARKPVGAFYMFIDVHETGLTGEEFCKYVLQDSYVTMTPGVAFGDTCGDYIRISYANSIENLQEAARRIDGSVRKLDFCK